MLKHFFLSLLLVSQQAFALTGKEEMAAQNSMPPLTQTDIISICIALITAIPALWWFWSKSYFKLSKDIKNLPDLELNIKASPDLTALSEAEKEEIFAKQTPPVSDIEKALSQADRTSFIRYMVPSTLCTAILCGTLYYIIFSFGSYVFIDYLFVHVITRPHIDWLAFFGTISCYMAFILIFWGSMAFSLLFTKVYILLLEKNPYFPYQKLLKEKKQTTLKVLYSYYKSRKSK